MTQKKTTKRALVASILSLLLCVSMLIGSTFAWFTDTASTGVNLIQSGNLDLVLEYRDADGNWAEVNGDTKLFKDGALWEPGYTEVAYIRVRNNGSLAFNYQLAVNATNEVAGVNVAGQSFNLSDYIKFGKVVSKTEISKYATREDAQAAATDVTTLQSYGKTEVLLPNEMTYLALVVYMPTTVGNVANHNGTNKPSIDLGVVVNATQTPYENDSFGNDYDGVAPYFLPVGMTAENFGDNVAYVNGTYYATLTAALDAIHDSNVTESILYLKPNANLGTITHAHVCSSITIYGNNAYISGGERDFEIGIPQTVGCTIDSAIELNIYDLDGCAVWGTIPEGADVSVSLNNCENVSKIILPNYTTGNYDLSISIDNCTFVGTDSYRDSAIWCRGLDNLTITNTTFKNYKKGVNQNNKDAGVENYTLTNCTFIDCSIATYGADAESAPVRAVASASGATVNLTMTDCEFIYTGTETAIIGDVLTYQNGNAGTVNVVRN